MSRPIVFFCIVVNEQRKVRDRWAFTCKRSDGGGMNEKKRSNNNKKIPVWWMKYVPGTLELMEHPKCVAAPHYPKKKIIQTFISLPSPSLFPISFQVVVSCVSDNWLFSMRDEWMAFNVRLKKSQLVCLSPASPSFFFSGERKCSRHTRLLDTWKRWGGETSTNSYLL